MTASFWAERRSLHRVPWDSWHRATLSSNRSGNPRRSLGSGLILVRSSAGLGQGYWPIEEVRNGALDEVFSGAETKWKRVGVQLGLSTAVWGFKSGKVIDDCEYPQVRDSNKCPEGDLPTRDTHLRHLAPGIT